MKQTMQQIMIANLMLLCCCAVFSTPVGAGGIAEERTAAQTWQLFSDVLAQKGTAPAQWQRRDRETEDVVINFSSDEIERLLNQLRANLNLRPGKPVKAPKTLFYLTISLETPPKTAALAALPSGEHKFTVGDRRFAAASNYFLQPVRAGPGLWLV